MSAADQQLIPIAWSQREPPLVPLAVAARGAAARALGGGLHRKGHGVIVHPIQLKELGWFPRHGIQKRVARILGVHHPDVIHVFSSEPWIADAFTVLVRDACRRPDAPVEDLDLVGPEDVYTWGTVGEIEGVRRVMGSAQLVLRGIGRPLTAGV